MIPDYERSLHQNLLKGKSLLNYTEISVDSANKCSIHMTNQNTALEAALQNLSEHFKSSQISYQSAEQKLTLQLENHSSILTEFHNQLNKLKDIKLHPLLEEAIVNNKNNVLTNSGYLSKSKTEENVDNPFSNKSNLTLFDCIPIEKELTWANKCESVYKMVESSVEELNKLYHEVRFYFNNVIFSKLIIFI